MIITMRSVGGKEVARGFYTGSALVNAAISRTVRTYGHLLKTSVQAHASGRPGPNAPTGDYRRSIHVETMDMPDGAIATVGTNAVQGRRLEDGFVGPDSLGRVYNQPPFPHFGPAMDEIEEPFFAALDAAVIGALEAGF